MPIQIHQAKGFSKIDNDYIKNLPTDNFEKEMAYETLPTTIEDLLRESDSKLKIEPDIDSIYGTASTLTAILDSMTNLQRLSIYRKMNTAPTAKTKIAVEFQHSQGTVNEGKSFYVNLGYMPSVTFARANNNGYLFTITAHLIDSRNKFQKPCSILKEYSSVMFLAMNLTRLFFLNTIKIDEIIACYKCNDEADEADDPILPQIMIHINQMIHAKAEFDRNGISCQWMANGVIFGNFKKSLHIQGDLNCNTQPEALAFSTVFDCFIQIMKLGVFKKKEFLRKRKCQLFTQDNFLKHDSSILRDRNTDLQTHMNYVGDRLIFLVANAGMKLKVTPIEVNRALENNADADEENNDTDYTAEDNRDADRVDTMFEENRQGLSVLLNAFVRVQALADHKSLSMFVDNGYEFQWGGNFEYCVVAPLARPKRRTVTNRTNNSDDIDAKSDDIDDDSDASDDESSGVALSGDENDSITNGGSDSDNVDTAFNLDVIPDPIPKLFPGPKAQYRNLCNHPLLACNSSGPIPCKWDPLLKKLTPVKEYNAVVGMQEYVSGMREAALYYRRELGPLLHLPSILKKQFAFKAESINERKELTKCMDLLKTIDEFRTIMDLGNERSFPLRIEIYYYIGLEEASYFNEGEEEEILSAFSESIFNVTRTPLFSLQLAISPKMPLMYCWYQSLEKARQLILRNIKPVHQYTGKEITIYVVNLQCSRELQASLVFAGELLANGLGVRQGYSQPLHIMAQIMNKIPTTSPLLFPEHSIRGVTVNFKNDVVDPVMEAEAPSSQLEAEAPSSPIRFGICASYLAISGESEELMSNLIEMEESSAADSWLEGCPWIASVAIITKKLRSGATAGSYQYLSKFLIYKYHRTGLKFTLHAIQSHAQTYFTSEVGDKCDENEKDKYLSRIITTFARVYLVAYFHQIKWDMMKRFGTLGVSKDRYCNLFMGPEKLPPIHLTDYMGDTDLFCKRNELQNSDCGESFCM